MIEVIMGDLFPDAGFDVHQVADCISGRPVGLGVCSKK
jgi:hypothetical protein